ncbi:MAG: FAD-binding oxidoreductase [Xanthomonadales bacterium]|nr:FAD-binding oxidoreductase [Xanthomonadales bacterium]
MHTSDIVVIGAGIAGSSAAAELAADARVTLLEMEAQPGYHATGRSAAYFAPSYGHPIVRELAACSAPMFRKPPPEFTDVELFRPRDYVMFGRADQAESLRREQEAESGLEWLDADDVQALVPVFADGYLHGALRDRRGGDLDVDALLQGYLKTFRRRGGLLLGERRATALEWRGGAWRVDAGGERFEAPVLVNAAGAWVEQVAALAGLPPLGISPLRRTALTIEPPAGVCVADWPEMFDVDEEFYFKPDAGLILISPADETPSEPCDAQPEEWDVAMGVHRFEQATGLDIRHVRHRWAGLRTFAPDRLPVLGEDPRAEGFFWLAGQGGYGVMTAPAAAALTRRLVTGAPLENEFADLGSLEGDLAPERLITRKRGNRP